jgi:HlyD family secretion protein
VDAYPAESFRGLVRQVRNAPQTVQNVVTYDAVIDVDNPELKLKPGMTANVTFVYAEKDDVLRIPNSALRFRPPPDLLAGGARNAGGAAGARPPAKRPGDTPDRRVVWVQREGKPAAVPIRVGISDGSVSEVAEGGLQAGDTVITDAIGGQPSGFAAGLRRGL